MVPQQNIISHEPHLAAGVFPFGQTQKPGGFFVTPVQTLVRESPIQKGQAHLASPGNNPHIPDPFHGLSWPFGNLIPAVSLRFVQPKKADGKDPSSPCR